jgi:Fe-S-cluster containining protein
MVSYLKERCDRETDALFLVDSPCKHLGVVDGKHMCDIYETRPLVCRDFRGKKFTDGRMFYVPEDAR